MTIDRDKILAGRKAVEEYRAAHVELHEMESGVYDHESLIAQLIEKLKELGFNSIEEFAKASNQANLEVLASSIIRMNSCDQCPGKEAPCVATCWAQAHESKYNPDRVESEYEDGRAKRLMHSIHWWHDHWAPHLPLRLGDEFPMLPGCNIILKVIKEPELDWTYRVDDSLPWG